MVIATAGRFISIPFALVGVAMLVWNRQITRAMIAQNRAFSEALGFPPLIRLSRWLDRRRWFHTAMRTYLILFAVLWLGICISGLVVG